MITTADLIAAIDSHGPINYHNADKVAATLRQWTVPRSIQLIMEELESARERYPNMATCHDGYGIILEELDELWDIIKSKEQSREMMAGEAIQVGAMAARFLADVCKVDK